MSSFSEAFDKARKEGKKTFEWNGKSYSTQLKGEEVIRGGLTMISQDSVQEMMKW